MGDVPPPTRRMRLHPDRLLPADPGQRAVARRLYEAVRTLPVVSPHGHVDARMLLEDRPFADPASLLVSPDHYVTRLLHADGVALDDLGVGRGPLPEAQARQVWRRLCERWRVLAGTPVREWLQAELTEVFGIEDEPDGPSADTLYDQVATCLADDAYRPRALYARFGIDVLATTDDPCDDLAAHRALAADPTWAGRVVPTFRPDRYLQADGGDWPAVVRRLGEVADRDTSHYDGYLAALEERRRFFASHGATACDHGHLDAGTEPLGPAEARRIYQQALSGDTTEAEAAAFRRHMLHQMAHMSCEDGLVMALHCGVRRDHHGPTARRFGPDVGADIPVRIDLTNALRPLLERFGTHPGFHLVVFTVDETTWSRELGPLAGFYPSVYAGVPWWFLDTPAAIGRFRAAVGEIAGFTRTSGFVDDTRAFCSIPARHDMARRVDAGVLARLVAEHRLDEEEATQLAVDLVAVQPRRVFKL